MIIYFDLIQNSQFLGDLGNKRTGKEFETLANDLTGSGIDIQNLALQSPIAVDILLDRINITYHVAFDSNGSIRVRDGFLDTFLGNLLLPWQVL
jgi:hypothetical protein